MTGRPLATVVLLLASAIPAAAQQSVQLEFAAGRVTLSARNAPVRAILSEWARVGGATIVNGDRVAGPAVSLELKSVPERQAIDIILRTVAGYMIAPRPTGSPGASAFDRIVILPTSTAPPPPPPVAATQRRPVRPPILPPPPIEAEQPLEPELIESPSEVPPDDPSSIVQPQPGRPIDRRLLGPVGAPENGDPTSGGDEEPSNPPVVPTTPSNPFGVPAGSSARPGVIAQPSGGQGPGTTRVQ